MKVIALVGCPNVGKSTFFNRLTKTRDALVADFPGLTRDRKYGRALYEGREFVVIDTGGIAEDATNQPEEVTSRMTNQALMAIDESDLVLFMLDARAGILPGDYSVADYIRRSGKKCAIIANKVDGLDPETAGAEFYALGLGEVYPTAVAHGRGVANVLEDVIAPLLREEGPLDCDLSPEELEERENQRLQEEEQMWEEGYDFLENVPVDMVGGGFDWHEHKEKFRARMKGEDVDSPTEDSRDTPFADLPIKFAIVGKPNVGKSTLTNRILGEDRVIVADHPGTTRDSIYIPLQRGDKKYIVIDTAGVRKRRKVSEAIEKFSIVKTLKAIEDCNVALLVIDARAHITDQDLSLLGFILESGRALVIAVNKWDGLDMAVKDEIKLELNSRLGFVDFARVHFISALHGTGVGNLFDSIDEAYEGATTRHSASLLNRILRAAIEEHEPPISGGRRIKLKFAHAGGYNPPRIIIHGNKVSKVPDAYKRYIINCYRKSLNIMGSPVIIDFKEGENPYANEKPAQKRQTQSQMRAERRKAANERMWARAEAKQDKEERKLIAKAKKEGSGLVLAKRPRKKAATTTSKAKK
ncbi:MAG: ribosome biogenesis GTPase Der [Succinivibrio dextrinosolvens]|uniref:ribosome biogenesis GTPase Der n=1 Tax=Succinivibrio sp. TaxID=2053619 RepID=UPI0025F947F4|nr:ribosome biogenesis GTPase Der [Succinivibrio sp.]MBQ9221631.1 ribosome biogenesis GTPase Der [Succinivibrio sp.]MDY6415929.1 ribosome biogenesis GTPase Der [Succinivibrio dextrinosolvens]MDY6465108.1 ribosome biogenesis GTPase Der [Succinivibrio dextrinosolvens]MDY6470422.1 ribosome biogenesis GTPase Der [Succinivibrio dextrinosolvens]